MVMKMQIITGLTFPVPAPPPPSVSSSLSFNSQSILPVKPPLSTSFFNGGVHAIRISGMKSSTYSRVQCHRCGGGALGARMNLIDRFFGRVKSHAKAVKSSLKKAGKILKLTMGGMDDYLKKMNLGEAEIRASKKRLENKYKAAEQASEEWYLEAQRALNKGSEDLAREALRRRKSCAEYAIAVKALRNKQENVHVSNKRLLGNQIQEAQSNDPLKASEMLGNVEVNASSALSAFEITKKKVLALESQAEALGQLTTDDLESKKGEFPPGRKVFISSNKEFPIEDPDIEIELKELRRRIGSFEI